MTQENTPNLCKNCQKEYQKKRPTQQFCRQSCAFEYLRTQQKQGKNLRGKAKTPKVLPDSKPLKICPSCNKGFKPRRKSKKYCSHLCYSFSKITYRVPNFEMYKEILYGLRHNDRKRYKNMYKKNTSKS